MTRAELSLAISRQTKISVKKTENLIDAFCSTVTDALTRGERIVYSNFGTFYTVHYPSKVIYHPVLGKQKKMVMLPTNAVKWMASGNIKDMVASGKKISGATSFGATKKLQKINQKSSLPERKIAGMNDEEELPIRIVRKQEPSDKVQSEDEEIEIPINKPSPITSSPVDNQDSKETHDEDKQDTSSSFWDDLFKHENEAQHGVNNESPIKPEVIDTKSDTNTDNPKEKRKFSLFGLGVFDHQKEEKVSSLPPETSKPAEIAAQASPEVPSENKAEFTHDLSPFTATSIGYADLSNTTVPKETLQLLPEKIARKYQVLPVSEENGTLTVGMVDPEDIEALEIVKKIVRKKILPKLTNETDLSHILDQYQGFETEVKEAIDLAQKDRPEEEIIPKNKVINASDSAPASRIISSLLKRAIRDKASDIHIEPSEGEVIVRFRIDGILHKKVSLPKEMQQALISRIKILSELKIDEQRLPQDGRFSIIVDSRKIDFRVSTMPVANGEKAVLRVLDKVSGVISLKELGLRERDLSVIDSNSRKSHGMILVTGPTGSGKTTTLYALLDKIYIEGINIITLEDPIEYRIPGINQSQVNPDIEYTFASGLRSILRQDPDVIMIGEIRDNETAEMGVHAALTGHVVLSTLHTNDSAGTIPRLLDMSIEPFLLNSSLNVIVAQRLSRKICTSCKTEFNPTKEEVKKIMSEIDKLPKAEKEKLRSKDFKFFKGKGCRDCSDTGYKGRIGLYEVLEVSESIKELIAKRGSSVEIKDASVKEGMTTMIQDGILKALSGETTLEEVWRVTRE